eukprot:COSAG01_NODE_47361_length_391_cov_0.702055_1_plen_79_part_10
MCRARVAAQVITLNYRFPKPWVAVADALRAYFDFDFPALAQPECQIPMTPMEGVLLRTRVTAATLPFVCALVGFGLWME